MSNTKWTEAVYYALYSELVARFGPRSTWPMKTLPAASKTYKKWLVEVAESLTELTGQEFTSKAVAQQLQFALTTQKRIAKRHASSFLANKYWGHRTGFLDSKDVPEVYCEYA